MPGYVSRAKNAVLDWAADNHETLEKWGEGAKYAGVGVGAALAGYGLSQGMEPGSHSRFFILPAAVIFGAGESVKVLGEFARDLRDGETHPAKNSGYIARITAPAVAAWYGSDGVWSPGYDMGVPIATWVAGAASDSAGKKAIRNEKRREAENLRSRLSRYSNKGIAEETMYAISRKRNPDAAIDLVAETVPLRELRENDFIENL